MRDPDDWFGGAAPEEAEEHGRSEDWLQDDLPARQPWYEAIDRRVVVIAVVCIGLLIAVLAAAGVFSGSSHPAVVTATVPTTPVTTTTATTTAARQQVPAPTAPLKPGDSGAQVKVLQRALATLGFSTGTVDGDYGPGTADAVKQFQRSAGLDVDGVVGPATLRALAAALGNR